MESGSCVSVAADSILAPFFDKALHERFRLNLDGSVENDSLAQRGRRLLEEIENYVGDDPLQPWLRFIQWAREAFPKDGLKSELHPFLELCAKTFLNDERYHSDIRYLRVWIRYVDTSPEDEDKFAILESKGIGRGHSLFYEAYATYMEMRKDFRKAFEIYKRGILRKAQPLGRLENMYHSFLERMAKRLERQRGNMATSKKKGEQACQRGGETSKQSGKQTVGVNTCSQQKVEPVHSSIQHANGISSHHKPFTSASCNAHMEGPMPVGSCSKGLLFQREGCSRDSHDAYVDEQYILGSRLGLQSSPPSAAEPPAAGKYGATGRSADPAVFAYNTSLLTCDGIERCFEEVRMEDWSEKCAKLLSPSTKSAGQLAYSMRSITNRNQNTPPSGLKQLLCVGEQVHEKSSVDFYEEEVKHTNDQSNWQAKEDKVALDVELSNLDCQGGHLNVVSRVDNQTCVAIAENTNEASGICGDETVHIKKFVQEAIVSKDDQDLVNVESLSHHGLIDPTINTKEALADILSMFNEPLPVQKLKQKDGLIKKRKPSVISASRAEEFQVYIDEDLQVKNHCKLEASGQKSNSSYTDNKENLDLIVSVHGSSEEPLERRDIVSERIFHDEGKGEHLLCTYSSSLQELNEAIQNITQLSYMKGQCKVDELAVKSVNPWDIDIVKRLLKNLRPPLSHYEGFHASNKRYSGSNSFLSLKNGAHNKVLELGCSRYHVKGCTGQGAFAQVYRAYDEDDYEKTVALKIQRPPWPWEFYIYRQLDERIAKGERSSFGSASKVYTFSDCSVMVCDYGEYGTLQDVVNSYLASGQRMDEVLCMYYTIEMLRMLEMLHSVGIIHGDFKPDNLLIRNHSVEWEDWAPHRPGCWNDQGLCLIDWGRSIDLKLFPEDVEFEGDCQTSGFRCIEMQERRPWTFQVDTYGVCAVVHTMLHGSYMEVGVEIGADQKQTYFPKAGLKRYWNRDLWKQFFGILLNITRYKENPPLGPLRAQFEKYLMTNPPLCKKLKYLLMKQSSIMYSRK